MATLSRTSHLDQDVDRLYETIHQRIVQAQDRIVRNIDHIRTLTYWHSGKNIKDTIDGRATYGDQIVTLLSRRLMATHGKGYSRTNLFNFMRFYEIYPDEQIVHALSGQLSWTHFRTLIYIDNPQERAFYTDLCQHENWPTRDLTAKIAGQLFKRTALSKQPAELIEKELRALRQGQPISPALVLRDPYILDFLQLPAQFSESDLEQAILNQLVLFLQELGGDFCFVDRQKRISVGRKDHYLDLLFYHRTLRRLIAIELKLDAFQPEHKGQMELYLKWLNKHERRPGEEAPLGIILCEQKDQEEIELLELEESDIHVAEYWLSLPSKAWLEQKLHEAILLAKEKLKDQSVIESKDNTE